MVTDIAWYSEENRVVGLFATFFFLSYIFRIAWAGEKLEGANGEKGERV